MGHLDARDVGPPIHSQGFYHFTALSLHPDVPPLADPGSTCHHRLVQSVSYNAVRVGRYTSRLLAVRLSRVSRSIHRHQPLSFVTSGDATISPPIRRHLHALTSVIRANNSISLQPNAANDRMSKNERRRSGSPWVAVGSRRRYVLCQEREPRC